MGSLLSDKLNCLNALALLGCSNNQKVIIAEKPAQKFSAQIIVKFSPGGGCTDQIVWSINHSKKRVWGEAYSFTSYPIGQALIKAKERGVDVQFVLDHSNLNNPDTLMHLMLEHGVRIYLDRVHKIMHNKIMIIDDEYVNTGSFNFTKSAEQNNAENCLLIKSTEINYQYAEEWKKHRDHSVEQ